MGETWRDVVGYEGIYEVSDQGRVKRVKSGAGATAGKILKGTPNPKTGHVTVALWRDRKARQTYLHRIVAEAFIGPQPEGKPLVLHWDDAPDNNRASNLRWGSKAENMEDALRTGRRVLMGACKRGHARTDTNSRSQSGSWRCRACHLERVASRKEGREFDTARSDKIFKESEVA